MGPDTASEAAVAQTPSRKLVVNLAVRDLQRSMDFFRKLGFGFNAQFTDGKAACMIVSEEAFVMLLTEPFFRTFTKKDICDTRAQSEGLFALSCKSRVEVDELVKTALAARGKPAMDATDHGFMYGWSFYDPDGHHWEVLWMNPKAAQLGSRSSLDGGLETALCIHRCYRNGGRGLAGGDGGEPNAPSAARLDPEVVVIR